MLQEEQLSKVDYESHQLMQSKAVDDAAPDIVNLLQAEQ